MSEKDTLGAENTTNYFPVVRKVKSSAVISWLKAGIKDTRRAGLASLFYGVFFALAGLIMHLVIVKAYWLMAALTTGFLLLGPFLAMGLYDLSRRMELGEQAKLVPTLSAWRLNLINVGIFAGVLVVVLLIWARSSMVIFAIFFEGALPTFADVILNVLAFKQPIFTIVYFSIGGLFAAFIFAISVIAIPLMADRKTDAITAAIASLLAVIRNPFQMLLWAICIVILVGIGFATSFLGLIVTMPIVGHASWHAYRDLVEAS
jgi:uncharacterized membrane protein